MDSLNKTRSLFYIKVREVEKALIKDIGPVNRVHLTVLVSIEIRRFSQYEPSALPPTFPMVPFSQLGIAHKPNIIPTYKPNIILVHRK